MGMARVRGPVCNFRRDCHRLKEQSIVSAATKSSIVLNVVLKVERHPDASVDVAAHHAAPASVRRQRDGQAHGGADLAPVEVERDGQRVRALPIVRRPES